jgi:hypothetical protein
MLLPTTADPACPACRGTGWVCEAHPGRLSDCTSDELDACHCGAPGTPCVRCYPETPAEPPAMPASFLPYDKIN